MSYIEDIRAREILDSRGNPTLKLRSSLKMVVSEELQSHPVLQPAFTKPWNCVTVIIPATWVKVFYRL